MSSVTVDSLELELKTNAGQAASGVDTLTASLTRLRSALSGGIQGLNTISKQIGRLNTSITGVKGSSTTLNELGDSMRKFASQAFNLNTTDLGTNLKNYSTALKNLKTDSEGLTKASTELKKLKNASSESSDIADNIESIDNNLEKLNGTASKFTNGAANFSHAFGLLKNAAKSVFSLITDTISMSNQYIENMNLFQVTMGEYAEEAQAYAEKVGNIMGIDPGDWMRNQGVFNTIIKGFGVASDKAALMSKNLTQLGYDLSSFYNISVADAMQKIQSGISGELEPLRRLGYDLSIARLQQEALNLGIQKSVNNMTQAEKSQLRYYAILTQVTDAQTDMARTLSAPANQLRILSAQVQMCARSIGNLFIPMLNTVIPYIIAFVRVLREAVEWIAKFFGISYSSKSDIFSNVGASMGGAAIAAEDIADGAGSASKNIGKASEEAKKLKNNLLGIDELNIISPDDDEDPLSNLTGSGGVGDLGIGGAGGDLGIDLPEYDFLQGLEDRISSITDKVRDALPIIGGLGLAIAGLELAKLLGHLFGIDNLIKSLGFTGFLQVWVGSMLIIAGLLGAIWSSIDMIKNGVNWKNAAGLLSSILGIAGGVWLVMKKLRPELAPLASGLTAAAGGIYAISMAFGDMKKRNVKLENLALWFGGTAIAVKGLSVAFKNSKSPILQASAPLAGFVSSMGLLGNSIADFTKNGPTAWNVLGMVVGVIGSITTAVKFLTAACEVNPIFAIAGIVGGIVFGLYQIVDSIDKSAQAAWEANPKFEEYNRRLEYLKTKSEEVSTRLQEMNDRVSAMKDLEINYTVAQDLVNQIFDINEDTKATASELSYMKDLIQRLDALGFTELTSQFETLDGRITMTRDDALSALKTIQEEAIRSAINIEVAQLQIDYIRSQKDYEDAMAEMDKIQSEIDEIESKRDRIRMDKSLTWPFDKDYNALSKQREALIEMEKEARNVRVTAQEARDQAKSEIEYFNQQLKDFSAGKISLPGIDPTNTEEGLENTKSKFHTFMGDIKQYSLIDKETGEQITAGLFSGIESTMTPERLQPLWKPVPDSFRDEMGIESPSKVFIEYGKFIAEGLAQGVGSNESKSSVETAMKGLADSVNNSFKIVAKAEEYSQSARKIISAFSTGITNGMGASRTAMTTWAQNIKNWFSSTSYGDISKTRWETYARQIVEGFNSGINAKKQLSQSAMTSWASALKGYFMGNDASGLVAQFYSAASDVVSGFNKGLDDNRERSMWPISRWAQAAIAKFRSEIDSASPSKVFESIGGDTVDGYNIGIENGISSTTKSMSAWAKSVVAMAPKFAVDTSKLDYANQTAMAQTVSGEVVGTYNHTVSTDGFADSMEDFFRENLSPILAEIASDTKRQADKNEQTNVYVGNRVVTNAVTTQRKANGYSFVGG